MNLPRKLENFSKYPAMPSHTTIRLDGNESCFPLPSELISQMSREIANIALHRYPDPYATEVCSLAENFWNAVKGSAVAGNGSDELISILISALLPSGGKLLISEPDFSMYRFYAALCELKVISAPRENGLPGISELIESAKDCNALILSNPCNPTGAAIPKTDALRIIQEIACPVIIDEAYMDFWDGGKHTLVSEILSHENLIVLKTCSKNLALAGIRLGFAFSSAKLAEILRSVKSPYNVNSLSAAVGSIAFRNANILRENTQRLCAAKDKLFERLKIWAKDIPDCEVVDTAANFVNVFHPDCKEIHEHLSNCGISVRFINGFLRISAGTDGEHEQLLSALTKWHEEREP